MGRGFILCILVATFVTTLAAFGLGAVLIRGYDVTLPDTLRNRHIRVNVETGVFLLFGALLGIGWQVFAFFALSRIRRVKWAIFSAIGFFFIATFLLVSGTLIALEAKQSYSTTYYEFVSTAIGASILYFCAVICNVAVFPVFVFTGLVFIIRRKSVGDMELLYERRLEREMDMFE